jgi:Leucine-rich repeat (LRR) protein
MEAATLSAAVSATLKLVGNKLAPAFIKKYSSIMGVEKDLQELQDLAEQISCWLQTVNDDAIGDAQWLKNLKDVAYDVEDVVDEFQTKAEKHDTYAEGGILSKYMHTKPKFLVISRWKAANKIKEITKRFAAIVKQRTEISAIANSLPVSQYAQHRNQKNEEMPSLPIGDAESVLGRDHDKSKIIATLIEDKDQQEIKIVSVIGLGGSGKTTFAKLVFNDRDNIEKHFEVRLWVHVSQECHVKKLVEKLFEAITSTKSEHHPLNHMSETISKELTGKRFLLVLDDVWIEDRIQWVSYKEQFMVHLKCAAPTSKILLTTRSGRVAEVVKSTYLFHLPLLSPNDSWQLFTRSFVGKIIPPDLEVVGKEIVRKCCGIPLAIIGLACVLSDMEQIEEWQAISDNSSLDSGGAQDGISACLRLSYIHMPSHLKPCFTICSLFPKGYWIEKENLIDLWIAHDMVAKDPGVRYLEYTAEKYFDSLVQMSFLQEVGKNYGGRVQCRMHDLVHDLAQSILDDNISVGVPNEATSSTKCYRYFSLTEQTMNPPPKHFFRKARAIYIHKDYNEAKFGKALKKAKHLRSVTVDHWKKIPTTMLEIKNLRYLELHGCNEIPEVISDIWSLQALHLSFGNFVELPNSIGKLQKLRTMKLYVCGKLMCLPETIGGFQKISSIVLTNCKKLTVLPNSIGKLQKLRRLELPRCEQIECLPDSMGNCEMISSIVLTNCKKLTVLPNSIGKLQKLRTLELSKCEQLECLPDSIGNCEIISSIVLTDCKKLTVLPNSIGRNEKLRVLRLGNTNIVKLPSSITTLRNLECLDLHNCERLEELPAGIGNLEKLQVLSLQGCENLDGMPVGIGQLSRLQKLDLFVVGKDENYAQISELGNLGSNTEDLTIKVIEPTMEPDDEQKACLKRKTNLQRLVLEWRFWSKYSAGNVNTQLVHGILDGLEPPSGLKKLTMYGYPGMQYARWMQNRVGGGVQGLPLVYFPSLKVMELHSFPNMKHLCGLAELPCLEKLELTDMPSLESISGGPFPSLRGLTLEGMLSLGEVWLVEDKTNKKPDGEEGGGCISCTPQLGRVLYVGNSLSYLSISDCSKLMVKPYLPWSIQDLWLRGCSEHLLQSPCECGFSSSSRFSHVKRFSLRAMTGCGRGWELLQQMKALESLEIEFCEELTELPESLGELQSLQQLTIKRCDSLSSLPLSIGDLTSLRALRIGWCDALEQLPECLEGLRSLREFEITELPKLTCLPQSMCRLSSLVELRIDNCPGITSLPEGIKGLTALRKLWILGCPQALKRQYWHLISHIYDVVIVSLD